MIRATLAISSAALLFVAVPATAQPSHSATDLQQCEERAAALQIRFIKARARQDAQAMAMVFAEDAVRVTPDGVFQGRDAIRGNLQSLVTAGLRNFTSKRTVLRYEGDLLLDAGEWHARLADAPLHGYYSAVLSCRGVQPEFLEETTNVAAPPRR